MQPGAHQRTGLQGLVPFNPLGVPYAAGNAIARVLNHALPGAPRGTAGTRPGTGGRGARRGPGAGRGVGNDPHGENGSPSAR